jgi:hypothetical protein
MGKLHPEGTPMGTSWQKDRTPTTFLLDRDRPMLSQEGAILALYMIEDALFDRATQWYEEYERVPWWKPLQKFETWLTWAMGTKAASALIAKRIEQEKAFREAGGFDA